MGEHWAVFGANGAGKSSFLRLLYGDLAPALGGTIERRGFPAGTPIEAWKRRTGYVSPELQTDYAVDVTLIDLVASGRYASIACATSRRRRTIGTRGTGSSSFRCCPSRSAGPGIVLWPAAPRPDRARARGGPTHSAPG